MRARLWRARSGFFEIEVSEGGGAEQLVYLCMMGPARGEVMMKISVGCVQDIDEGEAVEGQEWIF